MNERRPFSDNRSLEMKGDREEIIPWMFDLNGTPSLFGFGVGSFF